MPSITVIDGTGTPQTLNTLPNTGPTISANALPVVIASDQVVAVSVAAQPLPAGAAADATLTSGTQRTKLTDGTNNVAMTAAVTPGNETVVDRLKVNASLRVLDTAQAVGSQVVAAKGDQTTGLWVNVKNTSLPMSAATDVTSTGTLAAAAQTVVLGIAGGMNATVVQITGAWVGTIQFEATADGTTWVPINGVFAGGTAPAPTITINGAVRLTPGGFASVRVNATAWTSGTATITMRAGTGTGGTFLNQSLPIGVNVLGKISIDQTTPGTTNAVSVTNASLAVTGTTVPTGASGTANTAVVTIQGIAGAIPVPISGTISATTTGTATTTPPTYTNATSNPLSLALSGNLRVAANQSENSVDVVMQTAAVAVGNGTVLPIVGYGTSLITLSGTFVGTVVFEGTTDGTTYFPLSATQLGFGTISSTATVPGIYRSVCAGLTNARARISVFTSGAITATGRTTNTPLANKFIQLATGANVVGAVTQSGTWNVGVTGSVAVTGTFFQATQPVSLAALPALVAGAAVIGAVTQSGTWNVGSITTLPALPTGTNTIGAVNAIQGALANTAVANRSGTVTTGGTAQTLAAANTARTGLTVQNTSATDLFLTEDGATTAALNVGYKVSSLATAKINTQKLISIWGATTGQTFAATEF